MEQPYRPEAVVKLSVLLDRAMGIELHSQILSLNTARRYHRSKSQLVPSGAIHGSTVNE